MMRYLRVKNYERYQHYKSPHAQAAPAWIKLHRSLLSDYEFGQLADTAKAHLMLIWIQASQTEGRIPNDARWIADKIGASTKVDLEGLIAAGFLILECSEETTLECFVENESSLVSSSSSDLKKDKDSLLPDDLRDAWNENLAPLGLGRVEILSSTRRGKAVARLREHPEPEFWTAVLGRIKGSPFLLGRKNGNGNGKHDNWKANFDWLIENDTNCVKVYEGRYAEENTRASR